MKKTLLLFLITLAACSGKKMITSAEAREKLENRWSGKVGVATKSDFVEEFGVPDWCKPETTGEETCRFYKKVATLWTGEKREKVAHAAFDEVMANFDAKGVLKSYTTKAQR